MNCPKCDVQLRKLSQRWHENKTNTLCREVICDKERGGCGNSFWYEKEYTSITRHMATKKVLSMQVVERRGRVRACPKGLHEVVPCTCKGANVYADYLDSHRMIPKCDDCDNHTTIRRYRE